MSEFIGCAWCFEENIDSSDFDADGTYWTYCRACDQWTERAKDYLQPEPYDIEAGRILRGHTKVGCHCRYCKGVLSGRITLQRIERGER